MIYQHASYDIIFVTVSVVLALLGSFAALVSAIRIPLSTGRQRWRWVGAAGFSLGGGAIWSMHFIGMAAYHLGGMTIVYNVPLTVLSLAIAVLTSGVGLAIVSFQPDSLRRLALGGVVAGLGVAAMHYTGMAAMRTASTIDYEHGRVVVSIVIAVVAALAALFIAFRVRSKVHVVVASFIMAAAVCGMHYTGMSATRVEHTANAEKVSGADPLTLSLIVCVVAFTALATVIFNALGGMADAGAFRMAAEAGASAAAQAARRPVGPGAPVPAWIAPAPVPAPAPTPAPHPHPAVPAASRNPAGPAAPGIREPSGSASWTSSGSWVDAPRELPPADGPLPRRLA
jgi:NO-binding membrane sensor protein with MHYT domain